MQSDGGERFGIPSSGSFLDEGREGASAVPSGNSERSMDKRSCETDMRMMLGLSANILPHLAVWSILFYPPPPLAGQNPHTERRFVTKSPISALKRLGPDLNNR